MRNRQLVPIWEDVSWPNFSPVYREMMQMLNDFGGLRGATHSQVEMPPHTDAEETDTHFLLSVDLPGVNKNDIIINYNNNQLFITAKRLENRQGKNGKMHIQERYEGEFKRSLTLPENIDVEKIEACYDDGVLRVSIPKTEGSKSRSIEIKEGKTGIFDRLLGRKDKSLDEKNAKPAKVA